MGDFVISNKKDRMSKVKTVSFVLPTKKEIGIAVKSVVFVAGFVGLVYTSMSCNNLMLNEILIVGGILSLVFLMHILSNR